MPIPFLVIGAAALASLGMTGHSTMKQRKWKKVHDEQLAKLRAVQEEAGRIHNQMQGAGESLGRAKVQASDTLKKAAEYLRGVAKPFKMESLPQIPTDIFEEWIDLHSEIARSLGLGVAGASVSGVTAAAGPALYTAAGLFGVASTGTRIASLSGAAANSARLAWIGHGAVVAGGGGMALGSTILSVISKANIVTAPIGLAAGIWNEKKASDLEKKVTAKVKEFAEVEDKLRQKTTIMRLSITRADEIKGSVQETEIALQDQLRKAESLSWAKFLRALKLALFWIWYWVKSVVGLKPKGRPQPDLKEAHRIYQTAKALRELLEHPAISEANRRIIEESNDTKRCARC